MKTYKSMGYRHSNEGKTEYYIKGETIVLRVHRYWYVTGPDNKLVGSYLKLSDAIRMAETL